MVDIGRSVPADHPVTCLERWESFGATWQVLARHGDRVTIALCRCDGGEEVERLTSCDPELLTYVAGRSSSEE